MRGADLQVTVDTRFKCMVGNKKKVLKIEVMSEISDPTFRKDGDNVIVYAIPPTVGIIQPDSNAQQQIRSVS